jgi:hypothetical protein
MHHVRLKGDSYMDVLKKHYETFQILGGMTILIAGACLWLNGKFNELDKRLVRIETVMILN